MSAVRIAILVLGWLITAGVHSTVWIFAISAALTSRARWKTSSSDQQSPKSIRSCHANDELCCFTIVVTTIAANDKRCV